MLCDRQLAEAMCRSLLVIVFGTKETRNGREQRFRRAGRRLHARIRCGWGLLADCLHGYLQSVRAG